MIEDLYKKPTQQQLVYDFIKTRGRILTHELNEFGIKAHINSVQSRARELKKRGMIWHIRPDLMQSIFPHSHESAWSTYLSDKELEFAFGNQFKEKESDIFPESLL